MPTSDRRRLLGAGVAGTVLAAFGAREASASSGSSTTAGSDSSGATTTEAGTTTTAAPGPPTADDRALLAFILTAELAASDLFETASRVEGIEEAAVTLYGVLSAHHLAYANNIAGRLGKGAINRPNESLIAEFEKDMQGADATARAGELERMLAATNLDAVGRLVGIDASKLLASIVIVEGQHIAALAALQGLDPSTDYDAYVLETGDPITPDDFPAAA